MKKSNFNAINYSSLDLQNIERTCKIFTDLRNEQTNTRTTIYEVGQFTKYVCIIKQSGEYKRYLIAHNPLAILLKL
jgi:hypothetical protein